MFGTVSLPNNQGSSNFCCPDLLLLNARRIQAFLQQQDFLIPFDASELLLCFCKRTFSLKTLLADRSEQVPWRSLDVIRNPDSLVLDNKKPFQERSTLDQRK